MLQLLLAMLILPDILWAEGLTHKLLLEGETALDLVDGEDKDANKEDKNSEKRKENACLGTEGESSGGG